MVENKFCKFSNKDVEECNDFSRLIEYAISNKKTIFSIEMQMIKYKGEPEESKHKKAIALKTLKMLQYIIEMRIDMVKMEIINKNKY